MVTFWIFLQIFLLFFSANTKLDQEAEHRATSVYLVQQVIPMLPRTLCENLCSLNPSLDRLTFSVQWVMPFFSFLIEIFLDAIFPHIVSAILFQIWKLEPIQIVAAIFQFLNFCCGN